MLHKSKIGVCLDYSVAYLLEEKNEERVITIIEANEAQTATAINENKEVKTRKDHVFFKKVFEIIKDFDKVLLFGPTSLKKELLNRIKAQKLLHIEVQNKPGNDMITESEKIEFINNYFEN